MAQISVSVPAATAVLGYDLLRDSVLRQTTTTRRVISVQCTGSAAAGDTFILLQSGANQLATPWNTATGVPQASDATQPVNGILPGGTALSATITDAAASNPLFFTVEVV